VIPTRSTPVADCPGVHGSEALTRLRGHSLSHSLIVSARIMHLQATYVNFIRTARSYALQIRSA
jgi:hypothetical protein